MVVCWLIHFSKECKNTLFVKERNTFPTCGSVARMWYDNDWSWPASESGCSSSSVETCCRKNQRGIAVSGTGCALSKAC